MWCLSSPKEAILDTLPTLPEPSFDSTLFLSPPSEILSGSSKASYRSDRKAYLEFCSRKELAVGDVASLEAYRDFLLEGSVKASTVNRKLCAIKKGLVGYLVAVHGKDKEEVFRNLYKSVHQVKISKGEKVVRPESIITEEEIQRLIDATDAKFALMINFLAKTGCRVSEMVNVKLDDTKRVGEVVEVSVMGKGSKARTVYISVADLEAILAAYKGTLYLFETPHGNPYDRTFITKKLGKLSEKVLGKHIYSHLLRHSFATNMIKKTRKIQAVSEYLGHSDVAITLSMYSHETLTLDELKVG
jgi:integrase/recombinase XerD